MKYICDHNHTSERCWRYFFHLTHKQTSTRLLLPTNQPTLCVNVSCLTHKTEEEPKTLQNSPWYVYLWASRASNVVRIENSSRLIFGCGKTCRGVNHSLEISGNPYEKLGISRTPKQEIPLKSRTLNVEVINPSKKCYQQLNCPMLNE